MVSGRETWTKIKTSKKPRTNWLKERRNQEEPCYEIFTPVAQFDFGAPQLWPPATQHFTYLRNQAQDMRFLKNAKGCDSHDMIRNKGLKEELWIFSVKEKLMKWYKHTVHEFGLPLKTKVHKAKGKRMKTQRKRWEP